MATTDTTGRGPDLWRGAGILVLVVLLVAGVARFMRQDVVSSWRLLASCTASADTRVQAVSTSLSTRACSSPVARTDVARGWPVVTFVLPSSAGARPTIRAVRSDSGARSMWVEYDVRGDGRAGAEVVLAFVEVPPNELPPLPFTVRGATGLLTVETIPG